MNNQRNHLTPDLVGLTLAVELHRTRNAIRTDSRTRLSDSPWRQFRSNRTCGLAGPKIRLCITKDLARQSKICQGKSERWHADSLTLKLNTGPNEDPAPV